MDRLHRSIENTIVPLPRKSPPLVISKRPKCKCKSDTLSKVYIYFSRQNSFDSIGKITLALSADQILLMSKYSEIELNQTSNIFPRFLLPHGNEEKNSFQCMNNNGPRLYPVLNTILNTHKFYGIEDFLPPQWTWAMKI